MIEFQSAHPVRGATRGRAAREPPHRFQSTHPVRGATMYTIFPSRLHGHFNPRAPCGARPEAQYCRSCHLQFQSTRPVWGATGGFLMAVMRVEFQSTRPVWGATSCCCLSRGSDGFQSTRPVWGATTKRFRFVVCEFGFNPRAPCGARPVHRGGIRLMTGFNPRAPCGARQLDCSNW